MQYQSQINMAANRLSRSSGLAFRAVDVADGCVTLPPGRYNVRDDETSADPEYGPLIRRVTKVVWEKEKDVNGSIFIGSQNQGTMAKQTTDMLACVATMWALVREYCVRRTQR